MTSTRSLSIVLTSIALLAWAAPAGSAGGEDRELLVAAAVSLRDPLVAIARGFEAANRDARVFTTFGASSVMAAQLRVGAPVDVFISANRRIVDDLAARAQIDTATRFALVRNRLVPLVAMEVKGSIVGPEDLLGPEIRSLAVPEPAVPLGAYVREWLHSQGLLAAVDARIIPTQHARATLAAVESGDVDVAIVYATDARIARQSRAAWVIPDSEQPDIAYEAARVTDTRHPELAAEFLAYLRGDASLATLRAAGFALP
ncbi:MAG: molybdate ABC transporter substrate-binding protein [Deltaproteobacteria bacterium]|nr:molybdate ABC transporter substrate-binding protein [Deltaproteobacteria bacterium]